MKTYGRTFLSAVMAGAFIGFGGVVNLSLDNKVLGALFFTVGLFTILAFQFHLFTGRCCYLFEPDRDKDLPIRLPIIWVGNLLGTGAVAGMMHLTRFAPALAEKAAAMSALKTGDSLLSLFVLGIFCNIFVYLAVEGYRHNPYEIGKYLSIFFGVMVFILCGFEHCIADMFYFWMGGAWNGRAMVCILVITLGNMVGSVLLPLLRYRLKK